MQLRLHPKANKNLIGQSIVIKIILFVMVIFLGIFLLDKIDFSTPMKSIKKEISNDKLTTLK